MAKGDNVRKLSYEIAEKIRRTYFNSNITQRQLASRYNVTQTAIHLIVINKNYRKKRG